MGTMMRMVTHAGATSLVIGIPIEILFLLTILKEEEEEAAQAAEAETDLAEEATRQIKVTYLMAIW